MSSLLSAAVALASAAIAGASSSGPGIHATGLMCTQAAPLMSMVDVVDNNTDRIARIYMNEDLPRMPQCGMVSQQVAVTLEEEKGSFELEAEHYHIIRVTVDDTGDTLFVLLRAGDIPQEELPGEGVSL